MKGRTNSNCGGGGKYYQAKTEGVLVSPFVGGVRKNEFVMNDTIGTGSGIIPTPSLNIQDMQSDTLDETKSVVVYLQSNKLYVGYFEVTSGTTCKVSNALQISTEQIFSFKLLKKDRMYYVVFSGTKGTYSIGIKLDSTKNSFSIGTLLEINTTSTYSRVADLENRSYPIHLDACFLEDSNKMIIVCGGASLGDVSADIYGVEVNETEMILEASLIGTNIGGSHGVGIIPVTGTTAIISGGYYAYSSSGISNGKHYLTPISFVDKALTKGTLLSIPFPIKNTTGSTSSYSDYQWRFGVSSTGVKLVGTTAMIIIFDAIYGSSFYGSCVDAWFATVTGNSITLQKGKTIKQFPDIGVGRFKDCKIIIKDTENFTFDILLSGIRYAYDSNYNYSFGLRISIASVLDSKEISHAGNAPCILGGSLNGIDYTNVLQGLLFGICETIPTTNTGNVAFKVYNTGYNPKYIKPFDGEGTSVGIATRSGQSLDTIPILSAGTGEIVT